MRIDDALGRTTGQLPLAQDFHQAVRQQAQHTARRDGGTDPFNASTDKTQYPVEVPADSQFTVTKNRNDSVITVLGTGNADNFRITEGGDGTVTITNNHGTPFNLRVQPGTKIVIQGGEGDDTVDATETTGVLDRRKGSGENDRYNLTLDGGAGNDRLVGGKGDDVLIGGKGSDSIDAGAGNDFIDGQDGDDTLTGGDGKDVIYGGDGADMLYGNAGADYLDGGRDDDICVGDEGNDVVSGGRGNDYINGGAGADALITSFGKDTVFDLGYSGKDESEDKIYAKRGDSVQADSSSTLITVDPYKSCALDMPGSSVKADGSEEFQDRIYADLDTMRGVPVGRDLLMSLDASGHSTLISETDQNGGDATRGASENDDLTTVNEDGAPAPGDDVFVHINPTDRDVYDRSDDWFYMPPGIALYHELVHADDMENGKLIGGGSRNPGGSSDDVDSLERAAVGLPYDQDGNPATNEPNHRTTTENAYREALGLPLRKFY